jgi:CSLREA domain-containing protein
LKSLKVSSHLVFSFNKMKFLLISTFFIILFLTFNSSAAVLTVTTLADTDDLVCDSHCSLREALYASVGGDTIIFARELRGGTIQLTESLVIQRRITIDGPNKRRITLKGDNTFRILEAHGVVSIDGLIIRDGNTDSGDGGGINSGGLLNLTNIAILNCTAQRGGAIYMLGGTLFLADSTIANNTATGDTLTAGGIDTYTGTVNIINSTISGNRLTSTADGAGGILITNPRSWFIRQSTIAYNSSNGTSGRSAGGLVALNGFAGPVNNSILAKNTGLNPDFYGQSGGTYNIVGISDRFPGETNIVGALDNPVDPQIAPLAENNGGLPTHALLPNSSAIDSGSNNQALDRRGQPLIIDQRGYTRIINSTVDRGAFEFNSQSFLANSTITGQVTTASGRGVSGARIILRDEKGETRFAMTNSFGFYRFTDVPANSSFSIECLDKRYSFSAQNVLIEEAVEYVFFRANK